SLFARFQILRARKRPKSLAPFVPNRVVEREKGRQEARRIKKGETVEIAARSMDKVEAAATAEEDEEDGDVAGEEAGPWPVEALPEPPDDAGPVGWPMPEFCPLTIDGAVKESFLEALRKDAEEQALRDAEARSPESRPSSSKRQRAGTASPPQPSSSRSPYRNILQVFQQCKQDVA
ncbi:uncharacterized protein LOC102711897, partial [Oryza brachyantha]|uniref:uncharacterized protein LOC102711897 n=1 Tax=Oryza brachyantha TaxID=4533 RepID=UPI001ADA5061